MRIYINNRDLLLWPRAMEEVLVGQGHEVIFVDNASTYEPLLDYYKTTSSRVIRLPRNVGSRAPWTLNEVRTAREPFVVTDPDLDIAQVPADWPEVLAYGLKRWKHGSKCGLSLDETMVPSANPAWAEDGMSKYPAGDHPERWGPSTHIRGGPLLFHSYPVDTTFALYRNGDQYRIDGIRAGRPYTARHLPWHIVLDVNREESSLQIVLNDEMYYYYTHAAENKEWPPQFSTTKKRLAAMLEAYRGRHSPSVGTAPTPDNG